MYAGIIMEVIDEKNSITPKSLTKIGAHVMMERNSHFATYFQYVTAGQGYTFERRETTRDKKSTQQISTVTNHLSKEIKDVEKTIYETGYDSTVDRWIELNKNKMEFMNDISFKKGCLIGVKNPSPALQNEIECMIAMSKFIEDGKDVKIEKEHFLIAIKSNRQIINSSYFIRFNDDEMKTRLVHDITKRGYLDLHIEKFQLYDATSNLMKILGHFNIDNIRLLQETGISHKFARTELDGRFICDLYENQRSLPRSSRKTILTTYKKRAIKYLKYTMNNIFNGELASKQRRMGGNSGARIREYYF